MDKGIFWVGNLIYQKFEEYCSEVDDIIRMERAKYIDEETVDYIESSIKTVGTNVRQICSDLMQDVLPSSSEETLPSSVNTEQVTDPDLSPVSLDEDFSERESREINHLPHLASEESVKVAHVCLSVEQNVVKVSLKEISTGEHAEVLDMVASGNKDSSTALSFRGLHIPNHELHPASLDMTDHNSFMKSDEASKLSANSVSLVESDSCIGPDIEINDSDTSTNLVEISDDHIAEQEKAAKPRTRSGNSFQEANLDESCVLVENGDISRIICEAAKVQSDKKKLKEASPAKVYHVAEKQKVHWSSSDEVCESEWVII